jgi:outer membrane protein OmpA-like peptidoglycan-associated protein
LFMTNLLAIGLTASVVAKVFGFGAHNAAETNYWHAAGILVVFAVLSIPLGLSLKEIAGQAVTTAKARTALEQYFAGQSAHLYGVTVNFPNGRPVEVEALALVQIPRPGAEAQLQSMLSRKLDTPVALSLSQMPIEQHESLDRQAVDDLVRRATEAQALKLAATQPKPPSMTEIAAAKTGLPSLQISEDGGAKKLMLRADERDPDRLRAAVEGLARDHPQWSFAVRPEPMALPRLMFAEKSASLDAASAVTLQNIVWALKSAAATSAKVTGYADSSGTRSANRRMATKRAETVAEALSAAGIAAKPEAVFPVPDQAGMERELGRALFRRVDVSPQWMEEAQGSTPQAAAPKSADAKPSNR